VYLSLWERRRITDPSPEQAEFNVAGIDVIVDADFPWSCVRVTGVSFLPPIPPVFLVPYPVWYRGDFPSLHVLVTIKGDRVSVDPAQVVLRDPTGQVMHGTATWAPGRDAGKAPVTLTFTPACDYSSDTYDLILKDITVDGQAVEMPTVHFARGSAGFG
jgi:hypothetical protein